MKKSFLWRVGAFYGIIVLMIGVMSHQNKGHKVSETTHRFIPISWNKKISGDFSFTKNWSYPEGVYVNRHGQLSCDGLCPMEIDVMKDSTGRIYEDSLESFYALVDTTHLYHNFQAEGFMYEWAGSNQIYFEKNENGVIHGSSAFNAATHNSVHFEIRGDSVTAWLEYVGIAEGKTHQFRMKDGQFELDKALLKKGWIKAKFQFEFKNHLESLVPLTCEGKMYAKIQ